MAQLSTCAALLMMTVSLTCVGAEGQQVRLRRVQVSPPENTSLSASEYEALLDLMGSDNGTELNSLYRTSVDGTTYNDLLDSVGDAEPLVFVIRKGKYVFGVFINCGLELPDDPTDWHKYDCDVWYFSLAGHFPKPTKIDIDEGDHFVVVSGREGSLSGWANAEIGGRLYLGFRPYIRSCMQVTDSRYLPAGYTGERNEYGGAYLGGSYDFIADEIEVLHVVGNSR